MEKIDLHIHTNLSDGNHDINEIISLAKKQECSTIAITDHEIIKDYSKIALDNKINIINGIEFNTSEKGMHILAYGITNINEINKCMNELHSENEDASLKLIDLLQKKNINISLESVDEYLNSIGLKYTYLDKRHIVKYLISKGITKDVYDTYKNLIRRGTDLYIPLKKITSSEIISKIDKCGGISVLAHPFTLSQNDDEL
ncbi:MAG: PHP domain-containing protein [Bacilli bacterium]